MSCINILAELMDIPSKIEVRFSSRSEEDFIFVSYLNNEPWDYFFVDSAISITSECKFPSGYEDEIKLALKRCLDETSREIEQYKVTSARYCNNSNTYKLITTYYPEDYIDLYRKTI